MSSLFHTFPRRSLVDRPAGVGERVALGVSIRGGKCTRGVRGVSDCVVDRLRSGLSRASELRRLRRGRRPASLPQRSGAVALITRGFLRPSISTPRVSHRGAPFSFPKRVAPAPFGTDARLGVRRLQASDRPTSMPRCLVAQPGDPGPRPAHLGQGHSARSSFQE